MQYEPCDIPSDAYHLGMPAQAWAGGGEVVVEGDPPAEGMPGWEGHNCDVLGCGQKHVLMRRPIVEEFFDVLTDGDAGVLLYRSNDGIEPDECDTERAGGELRALVPEKTGEWYVVRLTGQFVDDGGFLCPVFDHVWTSASILPRDEAVERVFGPPAVVVIRSYHHDGAEAVHRSLSVAQRRELVRLCLGTAPLRVDGRCARALVAKGVAENAAGGVSWRDLVPTVLGRAVAQAETEGGAR